MERSCENEVYCNWNDKLCENLTMEECMRECVESTNFTEFCAYCENGENCVEFVILVKFSCCLRYKSWLVSMEATMQDINWDSWEAKGTRQV